MTSNPLMDDEISLFKKARDIAKNRESVFISPLFITTTCKIKPVCKHCSWSSEAHFTDDFCRDYSLDEIIENAIELEKMGIKRAHVPSGWMGHDLPNYFYDYVRAVKENTELELIGFSGAINEKSLCKLKEAGIDGYWCGLETLNKRIFNQMRPGDNLDGRIKTLWKTKELGLKVWSSFLVGVGETVDDIMRQIDLLRELEADNVMIMPLMPAPYTEMEKCDPPNLYWVAKVIAATRVSLDKPDIMLRLFGFNALRWGIMAGVNGFVGRWIKQDLQDINNKRAKIYAADV
jgi:biotin synthase